MSREILFKAKRLDNGEWVEGWLLKDEVTGQWFIHASGNSVNESDKVNEEGCLRFIAFEVDENTICQYTGLTDKNGNKIWENDVIQYIDKDLVVNGVVRFGRHEQIVMLELGFYVDWVSEGTECFKTDICYWVEKRNIEVIGNIFDNAELLKGE